MKPSEQAANGSGTPQLDVACGSATEIAMTIYRHERGPCLIEAGARDLGNGSHWQPWLRLTRRAGGVSRSSTFDGLKPVFGTQQAALGYAAALGKSLADEGLTLSAASGKKKPAAWPQHEVFARPCTYRSRARTLTFAKLTFSAAR